MKTIILNSSIYLIIYFLFFNSTNVISQTCLEFSDTTIVELEVPTSQTDFLTWYTYNNIIFQSVYHDDLGMGYDGTVNIDDYLNAGYENENSNFSGNIFYQGDVITRIDFSDINYQEKSVNFDINNILNEDSDNPFYINGNDINDLPVGVNLDITNLTNGKHVELNGDIYFIEIHGFEIGIDNLCVNSSTTASSINTKSTNTLISIFPNPVDINLQIKWEQESEITGIELFNITGKSVIILNKIYNHSCILDMNSLKSGIYFLKLKSKKNTITKKIIKL